MLDMNVEEVLCEIQNSYECELTSGGIAGGSIMLVVMITGLILSILWNKGLLPNTRTRKLKLESQKRQRRRRRREQRRKRRRRSDAAPATVTEIHATESVYSELNDYDAPAKVRKQMAAEDLYGTALYGTAGGDIYPTGTTVPRDEIYAPATNVLSQDIYGNSPAPLVQDIYGTAPLGLEIYGPVPLQESVLQLGGDIVTRKSNTVIPPIVPQPSVLSPIIPLEATLSSVFISLSSTKLNDPVGPAPSSSIPQPSKFTPIINKPKISPAIKVDTAASKANTTDSIFSPGSTFHPSRTQDVPNHPVLHSSINSDPSPETLIQSFKTPSVTSTLKTEIAGSNLSPVPIIRCTTTRKSIHHHPNVPRHSIDLTVSNNTPSKQRNSFHISAHPQSIPEPVAHQPSFPTHSLPDKRSRSRIA